MKVFRIMVCFPSHCGSQPDVQPKYVGAQTFDEAVAIIRDKYIHGKVRSCCEVGTLHLGPVAPYRGEIRWTP